MSDQEYVTYNQAAEMLDISRTTVERLIRDGALRTRKMPRSFPSVSAASVREVAEMLRAQNAETSSQRETARRARAEAAERRGPPPGDDVWLDSLDCRGHLGGIPGPGQRAGAQGPPTAHRAGRSRLVSSHGRRGLRCRESIQAAAERGAPQVLGGPRDSVTSPDTHRYPTAKG